LSIGGRFTGQALLDDAGLLVCMAYVDLNPIRAGIAVTPETSDFTSIYQRLQAIKRKKQEAIPLPLVPFQGKGMRSFPILSYSCSDYLELVD
jgi:hypothetical protein